MLGRSYGWISNFSIIKPSTFDLKVWPLTHIAVVICLPFPCLLLLPNIITIAYFILKLCIKTYFKGQIINFGTTSDLLPHFRGQLLIFMVYFYNVIYLSNNFVGFWPQYHPCSSCNSWKTILGASFSKGSMTCDPWKTILPNTSIPHLTFGGKYWHLTLLKSVEYCFHNIISQMNPNLRDIIWGSQTIEHVGYVNCDSLRKKWQMLEKEFIRNNAHNLFILYLVFLK